VEYQNSRQGPLAGGEIDLAQQLAVIPRRKWSIIALALLMTTVASLVVYSMTPWYKASATLLVERQQPRTPSNESLFVMFGGGSRQYYETQLEIVKSRKLAIRVIDSLQLANEPEFQPARGGFHPLRSIRDWLALNEEVKPDQHRAKDMLVRQFQARLHAELIKGTQLVDVGFEARSPELAAKVANALAEAYIKDQLDSRIEMTRQATSWMQERLKVLKQSLDDSEIALQRYKEEHQLVDVKGVSTLTAQELDQLTTQLLNARAKVAELSKRYGPKHPLMIAARSEVATARQQLERGKGQIQTIGRKEVRLRELQRQVESNRKLYDTFLERFKAANQSVDLQAVSARITDPASVPLTPVRPKKASIVAKVFFISLVLGVLLAFLLESLNKTFRSSREVEEKLGQPLLGVLPLMKAGKKDRTAGAFALVNDNESGFAEAIRTIRTGLVLSGLDNPHKVILLTSSIPGEGKTVVSTNLAMAMGKMEKVLLIGADLRRPSLSRALGIGSDNLGLTNLVAGTDDLGACIHHIDAANIDVLPCGQIPPNPLELLSSERFARVISKLEGMYDRIVIDSPPVQAVSDALVLSKFAKAVVYVVEADNTHENLVSNGLKRLLEHHAPIAGIVLNKLNVEKAAKYGYDYSGYYDHYGYGKE